MNFLRAGKMNMQFPLSIILTACVFSLTLAIAVENHQKYDIYGNVKQDYHKYNPNNCCRVPSCDKYQRCYDFIECGYVCSNANYPKTNIQRTPGYRKKSFYTKFECRFGECDYFKFTCDHCTDPAVDNFNIYTIRKDCFDCYEHQ